MKNRASGKSRKIQPKRVKMRRPALRKKQLVKTAKLALSEMVNLSPETDLINVSTLARRIGVTRQAIYNNSLEEASTGFEEMQRKNFSIKSEEAAIRRPLEDRLESLKKENAELQKKLDGWIEKWATIEYNAKMHGWDANKLFAQMPRRGLDERKFNSRKRSFLISYSVFIYLRSDFFDRLGMSVRQKN